MTETTEQTQTRFEQIGHQLKEAREEKNISLEHVAKVTRISIGILKDIEQGHMEHSPGPVFLRGFIRTYGEFIGLDSETLQKEFADIPELQESVDISGSNILPTEFNRPVWQEQKYIFLFLILIIIGGGYFLFEYFNLRSTQFIQELQSSNPILENGQPEPGPIQPDLIKEPDSPEKQDIVENQKEQSIAENQKEQSAVENQNVTENKITPQEQKEAQTIETSPIVSTTVLTASSVVVIEEPQPEAETIPLPAQSELLTLSIKATQATWLNITIDEEDPIEVSLQSGEEYTLEANERYILTIGNTKGVEFFLNGKPQPIEQQKELLENWVLDKSSLESTE